MQGNSSSSLLRRLTLPPASNMDKVIALFQTQTEKDDRFNTAFAEDMRSAAEERRQRMHIQEGAALNAEIKDWQAQRALSTHAR